MEITLNDEQQKKIGWLLADCAGSCLQSGWSVPIFFDEFLFLLSNSWLIALQENIVDTLHDMKLADNDPDYVDWMRLKKAIEIELARRVDSARKLDER